MAQQSVRRGRKNQGFPTCRQSTLRVMWFRSANSHTGHGSRCRSTGRTDGSIRLRASSTYPLASEGASTDGKRSGSYSPPTENLQVRERAAPSAPLSLLLDQDCLLPPAWRLVGTVDASRPAARSLLSLQKFLARPLDATVARRWLLGVIDPANELIPAERREVFP